MFIYWDGMHDGMESGGQPLTDVKTENWFAGAEGYRPYPKQ